MLRDPVAEFGSAVLEVVQVEPAQNRAILGDEHVERAGACLLLSQQRAAPIRELVVKLVAAVGDRGSELGAARQLKRQDRRRMVSTQLLQPRHCPTLPR